MGSTTENGDETTEWPHSKYNLCHKLPNALNSSPRESPDTFTGDICGQECLYWFISDPFVCCMLDSLWANIPEILWEHYHHSDNLPHPSITHLIWTTYAKPYLSCLVQFDHSCLLCHTLVEKRVQLLVIINLDLPLKVKFCYHRPDIFSCRASKAGVVCKAILCFTKMAAPNQNKLLLHTRSRVRDIDLHDLHLTIHASGSMPVRQLMQNATNCPIVFQGKNLQTPIWAQPHIMSLTW